MINRGTICEQISMADHALYTIESVPVVTHWFEEMGFGQDMVRDGQKQVEDAREAFSARAFKRHEKEETTALKQERFNEARKTHSLILKLSRLAIQDQEARLRLRLKDAQPLAVDAWHGYAACFYESLKPKDFPLLAQVGVRPERIDAVRQLLMESVQAAARARAAAAEAVVATAFFHEKMRELSKTMHHISVLARAGAAGQTNLAAFLKLTTHYRSDLPAYPGCSLPEEPQEADKPSVWDSLDAKPKTIAQQPSAQRNGEQTQAGQESDTEDSVRDSGASESSCCDKTQDPHPTEISICSEDPSPRIDKKDQGQNSGESSIIGEDNSGRPTSAGVSISLVRGNT